MSEIDWQTIDTAPKEGEPFIVGSYNGKGQWCSEVWSPKYLAEEQARIAAGFYKDSSHLEWNPTHWMPLPQPPAANPSPSRSAGLRGSVIETGGHAE